MMHRTMSLKFVSLVTPGVRRFFKTVWRHLTIQGTRRVAKSKFDAEDPQILVATVQKSLVTANWHPGFVHRCVTCSLLFCIFLLFVGGQFKIYRGPDKSLARPGRKQANVTLRMTWISFGALPCKRNVMTARVSMLLKSRASLTCFRACFLRGRAKDFSAPR